ncbi:short chain dehydrogenase family protein [Rickettsia parkeri str. Tate's Hell]|uniref:Short chain dehydrogenase family protein n=1 Tax=Rickettsia parkeri str. Tate's Hell TaxID=1359189 RepID=A0ABR5DPK7_RICPA|nr:short chain dehydrogenase family protein [Rickettsia parkeri str. AT\
MEKPDEIHSMFERIIKEFGKIDILVNNAGIQHVAPIDEFPEDKWEQILRID